MDVTHRLRELYAEGKHEAADTLAVEVLRNERLAATIQDDYVRVETPSFVGEHAFAGPVDRTDEAAIRGALARRGTYRLDDGDSDHRFTTGSLYDRLVEHLLVDPPAADESTRADASNDVGPPGPVDPERSSSVIRQAVAAVQSQFRR